MPRHVVLVGLPGSGKSTVGKLAADALGAPLFDIDQLIVRQMGRPVAQLFGMLGEAAFREMERDAVAAAGAGEPAVIVPGGGWAAQPGQLEAARPSSIVVYLRCAAEAAARRLDQGEVRPLLVGADPVQRMRALLEAREPWYRLADYEVDAGPRPAEAVAGEVVALARRHAGWPGSPGETGPGHQHKSL
ncbi:MAG TPA: shikimate kinase [Gemmatimonadales bacterium]